MIRKGGANLKNRNYFVKNIINLKKIYSFSPPISMNIIIGIFVCGHASGLFIFVKKWDCQEESTLLNETIKNYVESKFISVKK